MHPVILESLEEYLAGALPAQAQRPFQAHLDSCEECRQEVRAMQEISELFPSLKPAEAIEPAPGFAARVMRQPALQTAPPVWSAFSLDFAFARRVVFASLLTLAILGSYLVTRESEYVPGPPTPESIIANEQKQIQPDESAADRDRMLVTLTSYEP